MKALVTRLLTILLLVAGCIRDDVSFPPQVEAPADPTFVSESLATLSGNYFHGSAKVIIDDAPHEAVNIETTSLQFVVPKVSERTTAKLYVTTDFGSSEILEIVLVPPSPRIRNVYPNEAGSCACVTIKIVAQFTNGTTGVEFSGNNKSITVKPLQIKGDTVFVIVPKGLSPGAVDLYLKSDSGTGEQPFNFNILPPPDIQSMNPKSAPIGSTVRVIGSNLDNPNYVMIGDVQAEILSSRADVAEIRIPEGTKSDTIYFASNAGFDQTNEKLIIAGAPESLTLSKTSGSVDTEVIVTGKNLGNAFLLKFADTKAEIIDNTDTQIKTRVPDGAKSGHVCVQTPAGIAESDAVFNVKGTPYITEVSPSSTTRGATVTVTGYNLDGVTAKLGNVNIVVTQGSANSFQFVVPQNAVSAKVVVSLGSITAESKNTLVIAGTPTVTSMTPKEGSPGTVVTIRGSNFPDNPEVHFADHVLATVVSSTATEVICQVPANATTGRILVNNAPGPEDFTVITKPVLTSIAPARGGIGSDVTLIGQYLLNATVKFSSNITAVKKSNTATTIVVTVPNSAVTGPITITTIGGTITSASNFEVLAAPMISSFSPSSGSIGSDVTISGTNLQHNPVVLFGGQIQALIKSITPTQLVVTVPAGASNGRITVKTDASAAGVQSQNSFTVAGAPKINDISPQRATWYQEIELTGENFNDVSTLTIDGTTAAFTRESDSRIKVKIPATIPAVVSRAVNVVVSTAAQVTASRGFVLLGLPNVTKLAPKDNPVNWPFLMTGTNLDIVRKVVMMVGETPYMAASLPETGINQQAFNYVTTKVPGNIPPGNRTVRLYYGIDANAYVSYPFTVLAAPPPGVYPPANIVLPPPIPSTYVQVDLSNYWYDVNFVGPDGTTQMSCYHLRASFQGQPSGTFCTISKYVIQYDNGSWIPLSMASGGGGWDHGTVEIHYDDGTAYTGMMNTDLSVLEIVFTDADGRQMILRQDDSDDSVGRRCSLIGIPGPC
ncbi:IPT/TIG domain-containing protein [Chryseolinea sp. T2]|uniref:IPT/TIG domain-containing protein n=1 Tax=Chryseolinea sp. T2 TaxID=3129255 RepID=UPI00307698A0